MNEIDRMLAERECERLVRLYCHYVDHGEASRVAELFTEDGAWHGPGAALEGIDALREALTAREARQTRVSRHVCGNLVIDVEDESHARGCTYLTLYGDDGGRGEDGRRVAPLEGPQMVGEYRDRFVRTRGGWRIAERVLEISFLHGAPDGA